VLSAAWMSIFACIFLVSIAIGFMLMYRWSHLKDLRQLEQQLMAYYPKNPNSSHFSSSSNANGERERLLGADNGININTDYTQIIWKVSSLITLDDITSFSTSSSSLNAPIGVRDQVLRHSDRQGISGGWWPGFGFIWNVEEDTGGSEEVLWGSRLRNIPSRGSSSSKASTPKRGHVAGHLPQASLYGVGADAQRESKRRVDVSQVLQTG